MSKENQEQNSTQVQPLVSLLGLQYEYLQEVAAETVSVLGKEQAGSFTHLANDWMNVSLAISNTYPRDELLRSLVYFYLSGLSKEVYWFQLLFLSGNYALLHRSLRFVWEMIFRAHYVDTYVQGSDSASAPPGPTLDEKVEWLARHEKEMFRWPDFIRPLFLEFLPQAQGTEMEEFYKSLWDKLNEYVHPSKALLDRMVTWSPESWVRDAFSEEWALETIHTATMVFDLVWVAVLSRFEECANAISQKGLHLEYPLTSSALKHISSGDCREGMNAHYQ
jgi:hypothetical protein